MTLTGQCESPAHLPPGTAFGPYVIRELVGVGGMGEVYRAHDTRLGRDVALKVLPAGAGGDPDRVRRFELEARATASLSHPNILAVYDVGRHESTSYLVSELLEGESLQQRLFGGFVTGHEAVELAIQAARALSAAHDQGIVHRDLKPGNLFITRDGRLKILDFGLARLVSESGAGLDSKLLTDSAGTDAGAVLGTVGYMAPEQARGEVADARADIFALGVVLYEMLARRSPFARASRAETLSALLRDDPPPLPQTAGGANPALVNIVRRCLAKRPEDRFQSAHDLALALEAVSSSSWVDVAPVGPRPRRSPVLRALAVVVITAIAVAAGILATRSFTTDDSVVEPAGEPTAAVSRRPPQNRVAILPFVNKTGSAVNDALGEALAARLWSAVAAVPDVEMVPMTMVDAALASEVVVDSTTTVAAAVNAGVVVSGSIFSEGSAHRIQAVLRDLVSGHLQPPVEVVCQAADSSECIHQLAVRAAEVVELQLHEPELLLMLNRLPSYEAYRLATAEGDEERSLALDSAIGLRRQLKAAYRMFNRGEDAEAATAAQAVLDDHRGELSEYGSRLFRGAHAVFTREYTLALMHFRKAIELEPSSFFARAAAADAAIYSNRPLEVITLFADIAPCDNIVGWKLVNAYHLAGDREGELAAARTFHACFPQWVWMDESEVWALAALGRVDEMEQVLERRLMRPRGESFEARSAPATLMYQASLELRFRGDLAAARSLAGRAVAGYAQALDEWRSRGNGEPSVEQELLLGEFLWQAGREADAEGLCRRLAERSPDHLGVITRAGVLAARRGDRPAAERADAALAASGDTVTERLSATYNRSCIAAQLGDVDRALDLLREAVALGFVHWDVMRLDPDLDPLRDNPAFQEILRPKG